MPRAEPCRNARNAATNRRRNAQRTGPANGTRALRRSPRAAQRMPCRVDRLSWARRARSGRTARPPGHDPHVTRLRFLRRTSRRALRPPPRSQQADAAWAAGDRARAASILTALAARAPTTAVVWARLGGYALEDGAARCRPCVPAPRGGVRARRRGVVDEPRDRALAPGTRGRGDRGLPARACARSRRGRRPREPGQRAGANRRRRRRDHRARGGAPDRPGRPRGPQQSRQPVQGAGPIRRRVRGVR